MKKKTNIIGSYNKDEQVKLLGFIKTLPKTDLHLHLDGSIRPNTIIELTSKDSKLLSGIDFKEFKKNIQVSEIDGSLIDYLKKFDLPIKIFENPDNIKRITLELLEDLSQQGVAYAELRFAPFLGRDDGLAEEKVKAAISGLEEGQKKYHIRGGIILCAMRHEDESKTLELVKLAYKYLNKGVVAVDLAGNEQDFPPIIHQKPFQLAHKLGLNITIHAGETGVYKNIVDSVIELKAQRIGHGLSAIEDENVIKFLVERKIPLEMCIKSNIDTNAVLELKKHPIAKLFKKGVKITLNTDNLTVSDVTIMDEYRRLLFLGFNEKEVIKVVRNGIESSFAPEKTKNALLAKLDEKVKLWEKKSFKGYEIS